MWEEIKKLMVIRSEQSRIIFLVALAILCIVASPVISLAAIAVFLVCWYIFTGEIPTATRWAAFRVRINSSVAWLAFGLMLMTLVIHYSEGYVTYYGFPFTVVKYSDYPATNEISSLWNTFTSKLLINLLPGFLNIVFYYWVIRLVYRFWRKRSRI